MARASAPGINWRAAALLGLISSTWSTLASHFAAARIGRDAVVDWMVVAAIPLRDGVLQPDPGLGTILAGIAFHQWADFSWAVVFFALLGRWTAQLRPLTIAVVAGPWALFTSAIEWFALVPLAPFFQPVFTLNQPYWIGLLVHATSAALYPLFPWLRDRVAGVVPSPHRRGAAAVAGGAGLTLAGLGLLAALGAAGHEWPPHPGRNQAYDQSWMRRMDAHHEQGVRLGLMAVERAQDPRLRSVAGLIVASQRSEREVLAHWWRSWFGGGMPPPEHGDHAAMPGMLPEEAFAELAQAPAEAFDGRFVALMTHHHQGAIAMADEAIREAGALRIRLMSHAIRHGQRGEVELMHGTRGWDAVRQATANMLRPAGWVRADGALGRPEILTGAEAPHR